MTEQEAREVARRRIPRWVWVVGAVGVLALALLIAIPHGLRMAAESWLREHGQSGAKIGDVDFNPFTGRLKVSALAGKGGEAERLDLEDARVQVEWGPLFSRRIRIADLRVEGVAVDAGMDPDGVVTVGRLRFAAGAETTAPAEEAAKPWGLGLGNLDLRNVLVRWVDPLYQADILVHEFHLDPIETWKPDRKAAFRLHMEANQGDIRVEGWIMPFAEAPAVEADLRIAGVRLIRLAKVLEAQGIRGFDAFYSTEAALRASYLTAEQAIELSLDGSVAVEDLQGEFPGLLVTGGAVRWKGTVEAAGPSSGPAVTAVGTLRLEAGEATLDDPALTVALQDLEWDGTVRSGGGFRAEGGATASGLEIRWASGQGLLLGLDSLRVEDLAVEGPATASLGSARLRGVRALGRGEVPEGESPHVLALAELSLREVQRAEDGTASVGKVQLAGLEAWLARKAGGGLELTSLVEPLADPEAGSEDGSETPSAAPRPPAFRIGALELDGENSVVFHDESVSPAYHLALAPLTVQVGEVDSSRPTAPTPVAVTTRAGKYSTLRIEGEATLLDPFAATRLTANLESIHLPRVSAYAERHVGYALLSGELHLDTEAEIQQGAVRATNRVRVNKLELRALRPEEKNELTEELGMPLNAALSLLRDKNDDIQLTIPVEGDVSNPEFGIGDAVRKAIGQGLAQGVKTAAVLFFAPAGAILAAGKLFDLATALRFEPIGFAAGSAELSPAAVAQLAKLGPLLANRPQVSLRLGALVTAADRVALQEERARQEAETKPSAQQSRPLPQPVPEAAGSSPPAAGAGEAAPRPLPEVSEADLLRLGEGRAEAVKDHLVERSGIDPKRLLIRTAEIVAAEQATPRVEISL